MSESHNDCALASNYRIGPQLLRRRALKINPKHALTFSPDFLSHILKATCCASADCPAVKYFS